MYVTLEEAEPPGLMGPENILRPSLRQKIAIEVPRREIIDDLEALWIEIRSELPVSCRFIGPDHLQNEFGGAVQVEAGIRIEFAGTAIHGNGPGYRWMIRNVFTCWANFLSSL